MRLELGANTKEEIDKSNGLFVYFNVPHDTPEIRQNIRGLILCLAKARYYVVNNEKDVRYKYTAKALDGIEVHFMSDELLNRGVNSLVEIEFTLKHFLTQMGSDKSVKFFIEKPAEPAKDSETGEWILTDNKKITVNRGSVLQTEQYIDPLGIVTQKFGVADVLASAFVEGGVSIDPVGQSLFTIKSKFTPLITDINESKTWLLTTWYDLFLWFGSSFRESPYSPISVTNNPLTSLTIYQMLLDTFNLSTKTYINVMGWSIPIWVKSKSLIEMINANISLSFNEIYDYNSGVSSNPYLMSLPTWLTTTWKEFHDVVNAMKDCICSLTAAFTNGDGTSKIDDITTGIGGGPDKPSLTDTIEGIIDEIKNGNGQGSQDLKDLIDEIKNGNGTNQTSLEEIATAVKKLLELEKADDGCETTDNGDGTYTTKPIMKDIEPVEPFNPPATQETYKGGGVGVGGGNNHDAICGFIWYACNWLADTIWWLLGLFGALEAAATYMAEKSGIGAASTYVIDAIGAAPTELLNSSGGVSLVKQGTSLANFNPSVARTIISKLLTIRAASIEVLSVSVSPLAKKAWARGFSIVGAMIMIPDLLKTFADELACGDSEISNELYADWSNDKFVNSVLNFLTDNIVASNTLGLPLDILEDIIGLIGYMLSIAIDTAFAGSAGRELADYAQYCPCPQLKWVGSWVMANGETITFVSVNGNIRGTDTAGAIYTTTPENSQNESSNGILGYLNGTYNGVPYPSAGTFTFTFDNDNRGSFSGTTSTWLGTYSQTGTRA